MARFAFELAKREIDLIEEVNTMMTGVQAERVSPIVKALLEGRNHITAINGRARC